MLIQRLGNENQINPVYIDDFIKIVKDNPSSCDEVWLSTCYGFPSLEKHKQTAHQLIDTANKLRSNGIKVSLQVSNTIGHGEYISFKDCSGLVFEGSLAERMVGIDGEVANYCFCWNGENFRRYTFDSVKLYAQIKPENLWIDDDLRVFNHNPVKMGCFCDRCISKYNYEYQHSFTRSELKDKFLYSDLNIRKEYIDFIKKGLGKFVYDLCKEFCTLSPDTRIGFQNGDLKTELLFGSEFIFENMKNASGKNPMVRPGGGNYNDYDPNLTINKCMHINYLNSKLPPYVDVMCPEIENTPDVVFGKSIAGTCMETSLYLAYGNNQMSYAAMMRSYEPMSFYAKMLKEFSAQREYWNTLVRLNKNTVQSGLQYIIADSNVDKNIVPPQDTDAFHSNVYIKLNSFTRTAIPVSFDNKNAKVFLLDNINASLLSNDELNSLLDKNIIMDAKAFEIVNEKLGVSSLKSELLGEYLSLRVVDMMTNHEINEGVFSKRWRVSSFSGDMPAYALNGTDDVEPLGEYILENSEDSDKNYGYSACIIKVGKVKWAIFANDLWWCTISMDKRNQLIKTANYLSQNSIKAIVLSENQGILMPRENKDGKLTSVSFFNNTVGETKEILLELSKTVGQKFSFISQNRRLCEVNYTKKDGKFYLKLPSIPAFNVGTIVIE